MGVYTLTIAPDRVDLSSLHPSLPKIMDENRLGSLLTKELLEELDAHWPDRAPSPRASDRDMLIDAAQREVITVLWSKWRAVNEPPQDLPD